MNRIKYCVHICCFQFVSREFFQLNLMIPIGEGNKFLKQIVLRLMFLFWLQGYSPTVFYPKPSNTQLMKNLVKQIEAMEISSLSYLPEAHLISHSFNLVVDAIFGFR